MGELLVALVVAGVVYIIYAGYRQGLTGESNNHSVKASPEADSYRWPALGQFEFEVVGESNYQRELKAAAGDHGDDPADAHCLAALIPDDDNPHDDKAVAVSVDGQTVGYLSRADARSFRRRLSQRKLGGQTTQCDAMIVGGGRGKGGKRYSYGIRLDIKPFDS